MVLDLDRGVGGLDENLVVVLVCVDLICVGYERLCLDVVVVVVFGWSSRSCSCWVVVLVGVEKLDVVGEEVIDYLDEVRIWVEVICKIFR